MKGCKRTLAALLCLMMLVSCCACAHKDMEPGGTAVPTERATEAPVGQPDDKTAMEYVPETDFDNRYANSDIGLVETEDAYYWIEPTMSHYMRYYDKHTGDSGVLCGTPECSHDLKEQNPDCNGYIADMEKGLSLYEGKLYFLGYDYGKRGFCLTRMAQDGSGREVVRQFPGIEGLQLEQCFVHRGSVYIYANDQKITNAVPYNKLIVFTAPIEGDEELKEICSLDAGSGGVFCDMQFIGRYVYIRVSTGTNEESYSTEVLRWDTEKDALETVAEGIVMQKHLGSFMADREGVCWLCTDNAEPGDMLIRIKDGKAEEVFPLCGEDEGPFSVILGEGVIALLARREDGSGYSQLKVMDLEGNVLASGEPPLAFLEEYRQMGEVKVYLAGKGKWADKDKVLLCMCFSVKGQSFESLWNRRNPPNYLVEYRIADGGFTETLAGADYSH